MGKVMAARTLPALKASLLAYWSLQEASGSRADRHTNGYTLTEVAATGSAAGLVYAAAADLDMAADGCLTRARADCALINFDATDSWTYVVWAYPTAFTGGPDTPAYYRMIVSMNYGSGFSGGYKLQTTASGQIYLVTGDDDGSGWGWHPPIYCTLNQWQMIAWGYDGPTGNSYVRINLTSVSDARPDPADFASATAGAFYIGGRGNGEHVYDGMLGPIAVFGKVLSEAELDWLYNGGDGRAYAEMV